MKKSESSLHTWAADSAARAPVPRPLEAARLAKITGKPVQVSFTREEEFFYDSFRPAAVVKIKSGLDSSGKICLFDNHIYFAGSRSAEQFYDVPNNLTSSYGGWMGNAPKSIRSISARGARPAQTSTSSRASRRSISWRRN